VQHLPQKALKTSKKLLRKLNSPILFIILGLVIFAFGGINYYRVRILSFKEAPISVQSQAGDRPVQVIIPSLKIDILIETADIKNGIWEISYNSATFLNSSSRPGEGGNTVIYGHNKKAIFGSLPYLSVGQKVTIKTEDGTLLSYQVYKKDFVKPDRIDLVSPTDHEELTLFTCWGLFDSQRVVVKAKPISD